jgi:hypothetical protein
MIVQSRRRAEGKARVFQRTPSSDSDTAHVVSNAQVITRK